MGGEATTDAKPPRDDARRNRARLLSSLAEVQAFDRTEPLQPVEFDATKRRTHDYDTRAMEDAGQVGPSRRHQPLRRSQRPW
ncbi:hypothetical protein GCM10009744_36420 [Kribbella alba]|uniref:Uncharacterized protein n=1 Tax=Kribbella alba TaxID=190197 RepID=A0ABN2FFI6_9ACTN